ncbi:class Ib ribonucleoside-diphosphate reductase assembly flavoprotein NrdI [Klebsiella pneumoniae]|uniref:Protein NrdI n=1 Tax=Klebsiella pneumoniae TaxID=573 RepID=A0A939NRU0_KLEPN|nr:class Ib ribonucleoside-diphosphate reductase assembly flavoprotein NrdI [Klebsiella pneumoniae]
MSLIVYFSSRSENTHRFVQRPLPAVRIPLNEREHLRVDEPYILIVPSYGGGGTAGAVPRQAIRFLNDVHNRQLIRGVIAAGNRNFGDGWGVPEMSSRKMRRALSLPLRADGNPDDINTVRKGVSEFWQRQPQNV